MYLSYRLAIVILVAMLPLTVILALEQRDSYAAQEKRIKDDVLQQAQFLASDFSQLIEGVRQVQMLASELPELRARDSFGCRFVLAGIQQRQPLIHTVFAVDREGDAWCSGDGRVPGSAEIRAAVDISNDVVRRQFLVSGFARSPLTGSAVINVSTPYESEAGEFAGVVVAAIDLDRLAAQLDRGGWSDDRALLIADRQGVILVRQPRHEAYVGKEIAPQLKTVLDDTEPGTIETQSTVDGIQRIIGFVPPALTVGGVYAGVGASSKQSYAALAQANRTSAAVIVLSGLLSALLAWFIADRGVRRPVDRLLSTAERWREGDLSARAGITGQSELASLGSSFDALASQLEEELSRREMLFQELAHRTMNNLQVLGSLLYQQRRSSADDSARQQLEEVAGRVQAIALTYRNLYQVGDAVVDYAELLCGLAANLREALMEDGCAIDIDAPPTLLEAAKAMPMALIANELLTNAIKYKIPDTPVQVRLVRNAIGLALTVSNQADLSKFNPHKRDSFGSRMVSSLVTSLNGTVGLSSVDGRVEYQVVIPVGAPAA